MIAMQYSFTLPADYDMSIIDRRVRYNGRKLDGFPNLGFKAYLIARKGNLGSSENLYAPFYLWRQVEGMTAFLTSAGFEGVSMSFGWPRVVSWVVWHHHASPDTAGVSRALRRQVPIVAHSNLGEIRLASADRMV